MHFKALTLGALFLGLASQALALVEGQRFHQSSLINKAGEARADGSLRVARTGTFKQKLHHGNASNSQTFQQRYFIDSVYARGEQAPVFYIICGEWRCAGTGSYSMAEKLAKEVGAHLVALEHRFYGDSSPFDQLSTTNLETLTLHSAVEDLASFQRHAMAQWNMNGKWIAFGGSYAGSLAAFYRLKHPELVTGALASSAPVLLKNEFNEYDAHIASVINRSTCGDKIREAVHLIEAKLATPEGTAEVKQIFQASDIRLEEDFLYAAADMVAAAVQYGKDDVLCGMIRSNPDLIAGYAQGGLAVLNSMGMTPLSLSFQSAEDTTMTPDSYMRQWMWQSCQEFGWFQVSNTTSEGTSRSSRIDLDYHDRVCQRLFGKNMSPDGALNPVWYAPLFDQTTNRIIFTNGNNDPWLRLSVTNDSPANPGFDIFMMDGAAHCHDLRATINIPAVLAAQVRFSAIIKGWLN